MNLRLEYEHVFLLCFHVMLKFLHAVPSGKALKWKHCYLPQWRVLFPPYLALYCPPPPKPRWKVIGTLQPTGIFISVSRVHLSGADKLGHCEPIMPQRCGDNYAHSQQIVATGSAWIFSLITNTCSLIRDFAFWVPRWCNTVKCFSMCISSKLNPVDLDGRLNKMQLCLF